MALASMGHRGQDDMFLWLQGIKGESQDQAHPNAIEVLSWSWGLQGHTAYGGGIATGKATMLELQVVKRVDVASTALMGALRRNDKISRGVLTVRKSGTSPLDYFKLTIEGGKVVGLVVEGGLGPAGTDTVERLRMTFNKVKVEYTPQDSDGQGKGTTTFADQFDEQA